MLCLYRTVSTQTPWMIMVGAYFVGRRANQITDEFIRQNGLKKATNIRRGEIPKQSVTGVGIPTELYSSPITSKYTNPNHAKIPNQEIRSAPRSPIGEVRTMAGGLGVITTGGIKLESNLIQRPSGQNHLVSNHVRETGARILNSKDYQGTTQIPRVGTNRFSSPPKHTTNGLAVSRIINNRQFSPVPPHIDGSPRKSTPKSYEQKDGLMIEAGGQMMDVRGSSRGNSPDFKTLISKTNIHTAEISQSPQFAQPWIRADSKITHQATEKRVGGLRSVNPELLVSNGLQHTSHVERRVEGVRTVSQNTSALNGSQQVQTVERRVGGIRSVNPELLQGLTQTSELKVTNSFTKSMISNIDNSPIKTSTANGAIRIGAGRSVSPIGNSSSSYAYKRS